MSTYEIQNSIPMTTDEKRERIKALALELLEQSHADMVKKIDKAINSGAVDCQGWDPKSNRYVLPKCIVMAILEEESSQYLAHGTSMERRVKSEVRNIRRFI